jgi:hypothetical protein
MSSQEIQFGNIHFIVIEYTGLPFPMIENLVNSICDNLRQANYYILNVSKTFDRARITYTN